MTNNQSGSELFIVDNSDSNWKVREYLREWSDISGQFDIATGYFEIGSLLALDGKWQQLDKIRILMGDEMTKRTKKAFVDALKTEITNRLDESIENEKEKNDFLKGVPAIVDALVQKKIECRVFTKKKFHAKAYITHSKLTVVGSSALVGSSNFTFPGLTDNVELNIHEKQRVGELQQWFERHWNESEDVTPEILKVIERHTRDYSPFEIYARALKEYFRRYEIEVGDIGGYQVCHKWLKDRKGRTLSEEDIAHYGKITVALRETIRLMNEIDEIIEEHGGFPIVGSQ